MKRAQTQIASCAHCQAEFVIGKNQRLKLRHEPEARVYCSASCQRAGCPSVRRGRPRTRECHQGLCAHCGKEFTSMTAKMFCTIKCYVASDMFKKMMAARSEMALRAKAAKHGREYKTGVEAHCIQCGTAFYKKPSQAKRKYCSSRCYRAFWAARFDRWIASPQTIALPQAYDEFLSQEELPCLVEDCDWRGRHLSAHMNFAHGVQAQEFKRAAGFNLKTGVVSMDLHEQLCERAHIHFASLGGTAEERMERAKEKMRDISEGKVVYYCSREAKEHQAKARALKNELEDPPERICTGCGKSFAQSTAFGKAKFCTKPCRDKFYADQLHNQAKARAATPRNCPICGTEYFVKVLGHPAKYCSLKCRNRSAYNRVHAKRKANERASLVLHQNDQREKLSQHRTSQ